MGIKKMLTEILAIQKSIVKNQETTIENLKKITDENSTWSKMCFNSIDIMGAVSTVHSLQTWKDHIDANVYTKEQSIEAMNKEIDYRKEYENCEDENFALLELIEKYCKYDDKYKVIDLFNEIQLKYDVKRRKGK